MVFSMVFPLQGRAEDLTQRNQNLRVLLRRLNVENRMDIQIAGSYLLKSGEMTMVLKPQSKVTVLLEQEQFYIFTDQFHVACGKEVIFARYQHQPNQENGLYLLEGKNLYEGDLHLTINEEKIQPVLYIQLEDYLHGVVAYEMSDQFPIEGLKAQAIAARTYAIGKMQNQGSYDLVDTTNDQVYKGRNFTYQNTAKAIEETKGICGVYQRKFANCYYTASNGGQTELASHIWGGKDPGYIVMQEDPYDYKNPQSPVKTLTIYKNHTEKTPSSEVLQQVLAKEMEKTLIENGLSSHWENLRIDKVDKMQLKEAKFPSPSKLYTQMEITFSYSAKDLIGASFYKSRPQGNSQKKYDVISLSNSKNPLPTPTPFFAAPAPVNPLEEDIDFFSPPDKEERKDIPTSLPQQPTLTPAPTENPYLHAPFIAQGEITLTFPFFPTNDGILGLSINSGDNELITLEEKEDRYILSARRFGHGVGLSQRGAQQMAQEGKSYLEILQFYYPTMELITLAEQASLLTTVEPILVNTPGPMASPTPKPTYMPVTEELKEKEQLGEVTNIEENSYLNLRKEPNTSSEVLMALFKGQRLIVIFDEQTPKGWYHIKTDVIEGFVAQEFINILQ